MNPVYLDLETALEADDWRQQVVASVGVEEANTLYQGIIADCFQWIQGIDNLHDRDTVLLALPNIVAHATAVAIAVLELERLSRNAREVRSKHPLLRHLLAGGNLSEIQSDPVLPPVSPRFTILRRLARIRSWARWRDLPRALLTPRVTAISHNSLLKEAAASAPESVGFLHAEVLLQRARLEAAGRDERPASKIGLDLATLSMKNTNAGGQFGERGRHLIAHIAEQHLGRARRDLSGLSRIELPDAIWSGSGGTLASRAVGLEVLRRGGSVIRFDHGTPRGFVQAPAVTAMLETAVSSELVLTTDEAAEICADESGTAPQQGIARARVRGLNGDPVFRRACRSKRPRAEVTRPRVVYAPTQLLGVRSLSPAAPIDPVYLDWQLRVAEFLVGERLEFVCQPHPEGLFRGRPHPLEAAARTIRGQFEAQFDSADVFIFDYPATTALWQATCTAARIVYLDLKSGKLNPEIRRQLDRRAVVIDVAYDKDNRPVLDEDALRDAILGSHDAEDLDAFRPLLCGTWE